MYNPFALTQVKVCKVIFLPRIIERISLEEIQELTDPKRVAECEEKKDFPS